MAFPHPQSRKDHYRKKDKAEQPQMTLIAESESPAATSLAPVLRQVVQEIDRDMAVFDARSMQHIYINRRQNAHGDCRNRIHVGSYGPDAAIVGLYGLAAYSVSRRTREIGIRMALGADPLSATKMVLKQGLVLGLAGVAVGLLIGFFACRVITSGTFFNFGHVSVLPFAAVSLLLILTTIGASYLPARRASRIDPLHALREE
jgi:putative ABC transport system permease protein